MSHLRATQILVISKLNAKNTQFTKQSTYTYVVETKLQKIKSAQCHTAKQWSSQNLNPENLASKLLLLTIIAYFHIC